MPHQSRVVPHTTSDGSRIVLVELVNRPGMFVTLDRTDWDACMADGHPPALYSKANSNRSRFTVVFKAHGRRKPINAAQAILKPPAGYVAGRRSGDALDLRRANLRVVRYGAAKQAC